MDRGRVRTFKRCGRELLQVLVKVKDETQVRGQPKPESLATFKTRLFNAGLAYWKAYWPQEEAFLRDQVPKQDRPHALSVAASQHAFLRPIEGKKWDRRDDKELAPDTFDPSDPFNTAQIRVSDQDFALLYIRRRAAARQSGNATEEPIADAIVQPCQLAALCEVVRTEMSGSARDAMGHWLAQELFVSAYRLEGHLGSPGTRKDPGLQI